MGREGTFCLVFDCSVSLCCKNNNIYTCYLGLKRFKTKKGFDFRVTTYLTSILLSFLDTLLKALEERAMLLAIDKAY